MNRCILLAIVMATSLTLLACSGDDKAPEPTSTRSSSGGASSPPATASANATPDAGSQPAPTLPPDVPVLGQGDGRAATGLQAEGACSQVTLREPQALMTWEVAGSPGTEERVAVSLAPDGLERGAFNVSAPLGSGAKSFVWEDVDAGINHYWWVLTRQDEGYVPSETATFTGETCEADESQ